MSLSLFLVILVTTVNVSQGDGGQHCVSDCDGKTNGDYQSCNGCHVYVTCSNGLIYDNRPCPGGLVWDDEQKRCEYTSSTCGGHSQVNDKYKESNGFGTCVHECYSDNECYEGMVCIRNGCGHVCVEPAIEEEYPGPHEFGTCVHECYSDIDCTGEQLCCRNGCGHVCVKPVNKGAMWRFLICAAAISAAYAKDTYVVVTPKSFRPGVPLNISVNILKSPTDVNVEASLVFKTTKQSVVSSHGTFKQGIPGTLELQVPEDLKRGSYQVRVVGSGQGLQFTNQTDLTMESKNVSIFIQTDKAMYKPGQTDQGLTLTSLSEESSGLPMYEINQSKDPNTNKIKQWRGLQDISGVITNYMAMDTQPVLGDWKIKVNIHGRSMEKVFTVDHYVLPKFEVSVELPSYALTGDSTLSGKVKATYTYGKPVNGTVTVRARIDNWYRPYNYKGDEPTVTQTMKIDGEATFNLPLAHIQSVVKYFNGRKIIVEANVTESINKITLNGSDDVMFYSTAEKMKFLESNPKTFKPGLPYTAYLKVSQQDDTPIIGIRSDVNVTTSVTYELKSPSTTPYPYYQPQTRRYNLNPSLFTVPDNGMVPIQIDIPDNATSISLTAHYGKVSAYLSLSKSYSPSNNYIQLFLKSTTLQAGGIASFELKSTETVSSAVYQILSRGSVVAAGSVTGSTFSVPLTDKMAPNARIVVYYVRTDGEVVTDSISFDVDGAFLNKVSIDFDKKKVQPGENLNVLVTADPKSVVNLLAVDQSVLLLKSGNDITPTQVIEELKSYDTISSGVNDPFFGDIMPMAVGRRKRMIWWPYPVYYGGSDAQQIFDVFGFVVVDDSLMKNIKTS